MPLPNEHACRLRDPSGLNIKGSGERKHNGKTFRIIFGIPKGGGGSVEQAYRYPKDSWSVDSARTHCKNHDGTFEPAGIEAMSYKKDLLIAGEYPHPQDKEKIVKMDIGRLKDITNNTIKFLNAGGKVRITISHPKTEEEKIKLTKGWLENVWLENDRIYGKLNIEGNADEWIKDGKLKDVSIGVYHDVVTSAGVFPRLIDHVALTGSPHNLGQYPFIPMNAGSFSSAEIFFENHCVTYQSGSDIDENKEDPIKLQESATKGGNIMDALQKILKYLEAVKQELIKLFAEKKAGTETVVPPGGDGGGGNGGSITPGVVTPSKPAGAVGAGGIGTESQAVTELLAERDKLQKRIDEFETKEKKEKEEKEKKAKEEFETRIDKLIEEGKIKPENRKALVEEYETLSTLDKINFEGKEISVSDYILGRYEVSDSLFKTTLNHEKISQIRFENKVIDLKSEQGEEAFIILAEREAKELAKADPNCKDWHEKYEAARETVREKFVIER